MIKPATWSEAAENVVAAPVGLSQSVGETMFRVAENADSLLGFDIALTKKGKAIGAAGIVGATALNLATMQTGQIGPTENGIKTATPTLDEYFMYGPQQPSYANRSNADGDLVLAMNRNRNG